MAVSATKSKILTCWDKNQESYFDKKKTRRDVDKFPVNFSVVPHIVSPLENIFGYLDFKDLNNCRTVCKVWQNILLEKRSLWIELLEKEKIKKFGSSSENYDSLGSDEMWQIYDRLKKTGTETGFFIAVSIMIRMMDTKVVEGCPQNHWQK